MAMGTGRPVLLKAAASFSFGTGKVGYIPVNSYKKREKDDW
jgi:hypothetical protein